MKPRKQEKSNPSAREQKVTKIFVDGAGRRPDGKGSGFAWISESTAEKHIERVDGLTNNQAEYRGLVSALDALPAGAEAEIYSDSLVMCSQFNLEFKVNDPTLLDLLEEARGIISKKKLNVRLQWVPRARNLAGKLL